MTTAFRYRAANPDGDVIEGKLTSSSRADALNDLRRQNLVPIQIDEDNAAAPRVGRKSSGRREALTLWTRSVATLLDAGINLERTLSFSAAQERNPELARAITSIRADVHGGVSLAAAMRKHHRLFGPVQIALISAGEETGTLSSVMSQLAGHLEEEEELRNRVRSALTYPALMAFVTILGLVMMVVFVIPRLASMLDEAGGTLPYSARLLVSASTFLLGWWPLILAIVLLLTWEFRRWTAVGENRARWHALRLRLPIVGELEREFAAARFTRTFALLLTNGTPILSALRIARAAVANDFLGVAIERATVAVSEGKRLSAELSGVLPPNALQLFTVGEESGRLAELSLRAAELYESDLARRLRASIGLIEPALILIFGGIVGFVAIALLQAIYSINGRL